MGPEYFYFLALHQNRSLYGKNLLQKTFVPQYSDSGEAPVPNSNASALSPPSSKQRSRLHRVPHLFVLVYVSFGLAGLETATASVSLQTATVSSSLTATALRGHKKPGPPGSPQPRHRCRRRTRLFSRLSSVSSAVDPPNDVISRGPAE